MNEKKTRPEILDGHIKKVRVACGSLFISVGVSNSQVTEVFLNGSKLGGCRANQECIGRLLSLALRHNIPLEEIIDQTEMILCPACTRAKAKLTDPEKIKDYPTSCSDAVAKFLTTILDQQKKLKEVKK